MLKIGDWFKFDNEFDKENGYSIVAEVLSFGFDGGAMWGIPAHNTMKIKIIKSNKPSCRLGWIVDVPQPERLKFEKI